MIVRKRFRLSSDRMPIPAAVIPFWEYHSANSIINSSNSIPCLNQSHSQLSSLITPFGIDLTHFFLSFLSQHIHFGCRIDTAFLRLIGRHTQYTSPIDSSSSNSCTCSIVALYCASRSINNTSTFLPYSFALWQANCSITLLSLPPLTDI